MDFLYLQDNLSLSNIKHFITQVVLMFVLSVVFLLVTFLFIYMGDLFINSMKGNMKKPLFGTYVIMSGSMDPTIQVKDGIVIKRVDNDQYKIGDIITFESNNEHYKGSTITHRIIGKQEGQNGESFYVTKGDHNISKDSTLVPTSSIYGKVLFKISKIGYVQDFFTNPVHIFTCLLTVSLMFLLYYGVRILYLFVRKREV